MSEVNYRRNGMKYSTTGKCWGMAPKAGEFASDRPAKGPKPKSSRERRAAKKGKLTGETPVPPVGEANGRDARWPSGGEL